MMSLPPSLVPVISGSSTTILVVVEVASYLRGAEEGVKGTT